MAIQEESVIEVKIEKSQLVFLESKARELGISKEELVKSYIINNMSKDIDKSKKRRFSLQGITSRSKLADADIEEIEKIWKIQEVKNEVFFYDVLVS